MADPQIDRRLLKRQYKESNRQAGVYRLRSLATGKALIGSSPDLPAARNRLRTQLDSGTYPMAPQLAADWKSQGEGGFVFEVLEELEPPEAPGWNPREELGDLLALWLEELQPYGDSGYNRTPSVD